MSRKQWIIYGSLAVIFLTVTLGCIYYLMGGIISGINDLKVYEMEGKTRYVAGKPYVGKPNTKEAGQLFLRYRDWIIKDREEAADTSADGVDEEKLRFNFLSVINYPSGNDKEVNQFIGVAMKGSSGQLPLGDEEVRKVSCERRYVVFLPMKAIVRPPIHKVEQMIRQAAAAQGESLKFFYEVYYPDGSMQVEGFVD